jgi:hypothetical protein
MLYLHNSHLPIIHREHKSPKLMVDEFVRVKVGGLGAAPTPHAPRLPFQLAFRMQYAFVPHIVLGMSATRSSSPPLSPPTRHPPLCLPAPTFPPTPITVHIHANPPSHPPTHIYTLQVADFNLSKVMEGSLASSVGGANNARWLAPELLDGQQSTPAADIFAFGVVMWEVLTWDIPWQTEPRVVVRVGGRVVVGCEGVLLWQVGGHGRCGVCLGVDFRNTIHQNFHV